MRLRVAVLGSGAWGRAFSGAIADQVDIVFWNRSAPVAEEAAASIANAVAKRDIAVAVAESAAVVVAVSSDAFADVLARVAAMLGDRPLLWLTKGFDPRANRPLSATAADLLGDNGRFAAVAGPSFAEEVSAGLPTALVLAANRGEDGEQLRALFNRKRLRLYAADDLIGVGVAGAVKNIVAIAAGIGDGMRLGDNARCSLIARGLAEMTALGEALGGQRQTFTGLAGVGDLALTCSSDKSRNRRLGLALGANAGRVYSLAEVKTLAAGACEGLKALPPVLQAAAAAGARLPICRAVDDVVNGRLAPAAAAAELLSRPLRHS